MTAWRLPHGAAGVELTEPGGGIGVGVIGSLLLLKVHQHHGHVQVAHGREHVVAGGVGEQLEDDQVDVRSAELVSGLHGQLLGGDQATVDQFDGIGDALFEVGVLRFKLGDQGRELGQVSAQRDGEHADACLGVD